MPMNYSEPGAQQFGHASCLLDVDGGERLLLVHGGFGVINGKHGRHNDVKLYSVASEGNK